MDRHRPLLCLLFSGSLLACSAGGEEKSSNPPRDSGASDGGDTSMPPDTSEDVPGFDVVDSPPDTPSQVFTDPKTCDDAAKTKSYVGCDYWPTILPNPVWSIFDFTVIVANTGDADADVTVTGPLGLKKTAKVPSGSLAQVFLPWVPELKGGDVDTCASSSYDRTSAVLKGVAFHLTSTLPVTVYQFNPLEYQGTGGPTGKDWSKCPGNSICPLALSSLGCFSFSNDASLLLPSTAMTGNYRITSQPGWTGEAHTNITVTATQDGTDVKMKLGSKAKVVAGTGITAKGPGEILTFSLNAGDVAMLISPKDSAVDLSGSLLQATKPVQVIAGSPCIQQPVDVQACDHVEESVFPAETLGKQYFVTVSTGPKGDVVGHIVRFYGNVDGTKLTYAPKTPLGAPSTLNEGEVATFEATIDFQVTGDHEFAVGSFMEGGAKLDPLGAGGIIPKKLGDPSQSLFASVEQYRGRYIFMAPNDYVISYLDVVAPVDAKLTLDGKAMKSTLDPIGATGFGVYREKLGPGNGGAHELVATKRVGVQVIGYGYYASYQYPGGLDLKGIAAPPPPIK